MADVASALSAPLTPSLYPIQVTHLHRSPVQHYAEHRTYSWYVDVDDLPRLPRWLRPFARFEAVDHFEGAAGDTLRQRVDAFLGRHGVSLPGGRITALLMPRVLGRAFNPLSFYWCHDSDGELRCVIAEVQTINGERHAYLLPPAQDEAATVTGAAANAPFAGADGYYLVRAPRPERTLDLAVSLHRDNRVGMVATWRGRRRRVTVGRIVMLQLTAPLAPQAAELGMRFQAVMLRLRGASQERSRLAMAAEQTPEPTPARRAPAGWTAKSPSWATQ
jgi:DUF1365 family protein